MNSASTKRNTHGTSFVIRKDLGGNIMDIRPVNEKISVIRLRGKFFNISLISVHAQQKMRRTDSMQLCRKNMTAFQGMT